MFGTLKYRRPIPPNEDKSPMEAWERPVTSVRRPTSPGPKAGPVPPHRPPGPDPIPWPWRAWRRATRAASQQASEPYHSEEPFARQHWCSRCSSLPRSRSKLITLFQSQTLHVWHIYLGVVLGVNVGIYGIHGVSGKLQPTGLVRPRKKRCAPLHVWVHPPHSHEA